MDFWSAHGWLFLIGVALFPRLTILFFANVTFGLFAWLGWLFVPHVLAAFYATYFYWNSNPLLVIISWFFAFGGTKTEEAVVNSKRNQTSS